MYNVRVLACFCFISTRADVGASGESSVDQGVAKDLRSSLERVEKELEDTKERKSSLERECVIYQTQLDVRRKSALLRICTVSTN